MKILSYLLLIINLFQITPKLKTTKAFNKDNLYLGEISEKELNDYYGDFSNKRGDELLSYLYLKISKDNNFVSYASVNNWYKITDRNYSISNIIDPSTYDFDNDNGNTYYLNNMYFSSSANNGKAKAISTEVNKIKEIDESKGVTYIYDSNKIGTKPNSNIRVDKEHVWAKNHGFKKLDDKGSDVLNKGAPTDLHNLVAADHNTNSSGHNDYYYGNVVSKNSGNEVYAYLADGSKEVSGWKEKNGPDYIFEPKDEWKGNVARCLFYMATRYSKKLDVNTQEEPYLVLSNDMKGLEDNNDIFHGVHLNLNTMLEWHELDPVDDYEKKRNDLIYFNVQNNRNPYIDYPSLAKKVFSKDYDFTNLKETYNLHIDKNKELDILLPNEESEFILDEVIYDSSFIKLENNIKIIPLKIGSTSLTYKIKNKNTNEEIVYKTTINIKDKVIYEGVKNISLKSFEKYEFKYEIKNLFDDEEVNLSNYSKVISIDNNVIKAGLFGNTSIDVTIIYNDDNNKEKEAIENIKVEVKLSSLIIILIIVVSIIIVSAIVIIIIVMSKKKKKSVK